MRNPLLSEWKTPFSTPPFDKIKTAHFRPAVEKAIEEAAKEIARIISDPDEPTFYNTIRALDRSGERLELITHILFNLNSAETSGELQKAAREAAPLLVRHAADITLNRDLFRRVDYVYKNADRNSLSEEDIMLLEKVHLNFIHGGASLGDRQRELFRKINEELSVLHLQFEENVLEETNAFMLHLTSADDLTGLPADLVSAAEAEAARKDLEGWVFTLRLPSYIPFMQYSARRDLREKMFRAYSSRSFRDNKHDNKLLIRRIIYLRIKLAKLLGYRNYAGLALKDRMAGTPEKVESFLNELHKASIEAAHRDHKAVSEFASAAGHNGPVERWDWAYFSEKLKLSKYNIDDELLRPYFNLTGALKAVFGLAGRLFGLTFKENSDVSRYHPQVSVWEVYDNDDSFLSLLYLDLFPREGKSGGAWMTSFRDQHMSDSGDIRPLISVVANFTVPSKNKPSLLSFNELTTLLHEFGHALHGMLSKCTYASLSGTSVARDFVELPSQFLENYAYEKEWLSLWARHYETGEPLPGEIIEKLRESSTFNEGYACNRQLGFALLDMAWHTAEKPVNEDVSRFERKAMALTELFPHVDGTCISTSFTHIFGGGYAAGYYGYKWAEVLDADAFSFFAEKGIFDTNAADLFRENILSRGGSAEPMELYKRFRGKEPSLEPFLTRSGLK